MLSKKDVTNLYIQYGFEKGPEYDHYIVFFSQVGYFQNAEIVILQDNVDSECIDKNQYEVLGYSVRIKRFSSIEDVHAELFNGFFRTSFSNKKLLNEYTSFCEQQSCKLANNKYEYICGDFVENGLLKTGTVIDRILDIFASDERQLIILEASAGYGKTCTSFETIKRLISDMPKKIPLLAELSKNRKARIFRYVLLSEIDQKFPALSSELVTSEIKEGRIFLIIDGFDELISKSCSNQHDNEKSGEKEAQTMLDTIAQLISQNTKTKILLTSRKSSIFVGDIFDNWVTERLEGCNVTRLQLSPPSLRDWIGAEKIELLKENNVALGNVLNPVLLTLLRNEPVEGFKDKYTSNDQLIGEYLDLLLKREQLRQALPLSVDEQISIMKDLAVQMVQYDISAEEIDFIKSVLADIIKQNLDDYLSRFDYLPDASETKPSEIEFLTKLTHHALLDRVSTQNSSIGFINEFIFGLLIAMAVVDNRLPINLLEGKYFDIAVTAYASYSTEKRKVLYESLASILPNQTAQRKISAEIQLIGSITHSYSGEYFDGLLFGKSLNIIEKSTFEECIFSDCVFDQCQINTDAFKTCQFYNCSFYENNILPGKLTDCELIFLACTGHETFASLAFRKQNAIDKSINYERIVLEQFWKPGYDIAEPRRAYNSLLKGFSSSNRQPLVDAIESLVKKNILIKKTRVYELNFEKIDVIKTIVER